ncbi:MAG: hypothetical protein AB2541_02820 [Candidatus Thiodiazotropha sp.]
MDEMKHKVYKAPPVELHIYGDDPDGLLAEIVGMPKEEPIKEEHTKEEQRDAALAALERITECINLHEFEFKILDDGTIQIDSHDGEFAVTFDHYVEERKI